ncbi:hypothetical protein [Fibrella forsythiae]|uniref:Uncharacterized protein n=1 Tax=Fibrella forsythiae TaxID=2817061 RepID=A0ABS3JBW8_9BACT|nr:hypothetical protein [Fibrella forsythiae]MBO0947484.1 hypothetical protein [Fibrella forsythiae]
MKRLFLFLLLLTAGLASAQKQTAPLPQGNFFAFTPQLAKNTLLVSRFPSGWTIPTSRPFIMGFGVPFTSSAAENARRLTNAGFTHLERDIIVDRLNLPISKRYRMLHDADAKGAAQAWAASMPDSDPRKVHVAAYGNNRAVTSDDGSIYFEIGRRTYLAGRGNGLGMVGFDIETFADPTSPERMELFTRQANLGLFQGIVDAGDNAKIFQYGGSLANIVSYIKNRQDGDIYMRYSGSEWFGSSGNFEINANPVVTYYRTHGAFVGRDQYARRTFDDRSLWQKNSDGSIKLDESGKPKLVVMNYPTDRVTNFGVQSIVYSYEPLYWLQMWYEEMEKILCDWRWLCNTPIAYDGNQTPGTMPYPKGTVDIRPGLEGIRLCGWYRDETEAESMGNPDKGGEGEYDPATGNNRPLNPRSTRFQVFMRSLLYHGNIIWSDKAYYNMTQGAAYSQIEGGSLVAKRALALGQFEMMIAGNYQAKNFPVLFELMDQNKIEFIIPKRFIWKGNVDVGDREIDKPIVWLMKEQNGRRVFGTWVYPCQDVNNPAHDRDITAWIELDNGTKSGSWTLRCKNRDTAYDAWTIPAGFEQAKPENWRFQFTNLLGQKFTWTGSYNVPFYGLNPTPPAPITRTVIN